jgi:hypothetical protein
MTAVPRWCELVSMPIRSVRFLDLAEHLQVAQGVGVVGPGAIPVVEARVFWKLTVFRRRGSTPRKKGAVVHHVVAPGLAGGVGQATRMPTRARFQQRRRGIGRAAGDGEPAGLDGYWRSVAPGQVRVLMQAPPGRTSTPAGIRNGYSPWAVIASAGAATAGSCSSAGSGKSVVRGGSVGSSHASP